MGDKADDRAHDAFMSSVASHLSFHNGVLIRHPLHRPDPPQRKIMAVQDPRTKKKVRLTLMPRGGMCLDCLLYAHALQDEARSRCQRGTRMPRRRQVKI